MTVTESGGDRELLLQLVHDLKNPLGVMLSFAEEIPGLEGATRVQFCARLIANARRTIQVIEEFALLSDLRAGHVHLNRADCCWRSLIEEVVGEAAIVAPDRVLRAERLPPASSRVRIDGARVRHALVALLREATIRSRRESPPRLRAELGPEGARFLVTVGESGPEEVRFDERAPGIELARGIAELHGGSLAFDAVGRGTVATFALPSDD